MTPIRTTAALAGALYLLTFATSIPALVLKGPAIRDPDFVLGAPGRAGVRWSGALELLLAIACVGTAVVLYTVVRRTSEGAALGFVAARVLEAALIVVGVLSLYAIVTLRADAGTAEPAALVATARALVAVHDWTFLLGPGLIPAVNAILLGAVLYRARGGLGLVGAPLLAASAAATIAGVIDQVSVWAALAALPIAAWELTLGLWLLFRGFREDAVAGIAPSASGTVARAAS